MDESSQLTKLRVSQSRLNEAVVWAVFPARGSECQGSQHEFWSPVAGFVPAAAAYQLCDVGIIIQPLCFSFLGCQIRLIICATSSPPRAVS